MLCWPTVSEVEVNVTGDGNPIVADNGSYCSNILISGTCGGGAGLSESILVFKIVAILTKLQRFPCGGIDL